MVIAMQSQITDNKKILYLVMPAYNEHDNIEAVVRAWYPVLDVAAEASEFVIADSGSTDDTHSILLKLKDELPKLEILSDTGKQHGPKLMAMYSYAIKCKADYIFQTDSDGQTDPAEFGSFWNLIDEYDAILGNRVIRGDGKDRKFVENTVCFLLRCIFGVSVKDANAPFRLMKASLVDKYIRKLPQDFNIPNIMFTTYFVYFNEKVKFIPISFKPRQGGKNSINLKKIIKIGLKAIGDFRRLKKEIDEPT